MRTTLWYAFFNAVPHHDTIFHTYTNCQRGENAVSNTSNTRYNGEHMGMFMHKHLNLFLRIFVVFVFVCTLATPIHHTSAQEVIPPTTPTSPLFQGTIDPRGFDPSANLGDSSPSTYDPTNRFPVGVPVDPSNPSDVKTPVTENTGDAGNGVSTRVAQLNNANELEKFIYTIAISLGGFIAGLGGMIFDIAMRELVLEMGTWFTKNGVGGVVDVLWSTIRDLFNVLFIFALVFIGLKTILNSEDSGTRKALGRLIAAALLINFSLYIAKIIVDFSNLAAVVIYDQAVGGISGTFGVDVATTDSTLVKFITEEGSLSGAFMHVLNITSWFSTEITAGFIVYSLLALFFLIILGLTLLYGGLMLIVRFIAIIVLLIFSPVLFIGWILPGMQKHSDKWLRMLIAYSFFAPAYIFMLYLGLYTLAQLGNHLNISTFSEVVGDPGKGFAAGQFDIFLFYFIGIGFLFAATKVGQLASEAGAGAGMKIGHNITRKMTIGAGSSFLYRQTGGRLAGGTLSAMDWADRKMAKGEEWAGKRSRLNPVRYATKAGLSIGREVAGGTATRGAVESTRNLGIAGGRGRKEAEEDMKAQNLRAAQNTQKTTLTENITLGASNNASPDAVIKMERSIASASTAQLENLGASKLQKSAVAGSLSNSQFEAIMKSDKFNDTQKGAIAVARKTSVEDKLRSGGRVTVEKASPAQLQALGSEFLANPDNAVNLSPSQLDDLKKKLTDAEFGAIKAANKVALLEQIQSDNPEDAFNKPDGEAKKDKDIAQMPDTVLMEENAAHLMNANILKNILDKETLTATQRAELKRKIQSPGIWGQFTQPEQDAFERFFDSAYGGNF